MFSITWLVGFLYSYSAHLIASVQGRPRRAYRLLTVSSIWSAMSSYLTNVYLRQKFYTPQPDFHLSGGRIFASSMSSIIWWQRRPACCEVSSQLFVALEETTARGSRTRWTTWIFPNMVITHFSDLAWMSLWRIQGSRSSFLTLIVLITLSLEVVHSPGLLSTTFGHPWGHWRTDISERSFGEQLKIPFKMLSVEFAVVKDDLFL